MKRRKLNSFIAVLLLVVMAVTSSNGILGSLATESLQANTAQETQMGSLIEVSFVLVMDMVQTCELLVIICVPFRQPLPQASLLPPPLPPPIGG